MSCVANVIALIPVNIRFHHSCVPVSVSKPTASRQGEGMVTSLSTRAGGRPMAHEFDIVIRNGTVMDGNGGTPFVGDVAVNGGRIAEVGKVVGRGREEIEADGLSVTPGFVDIHTHYDGQAMWDSQPAPSSWHGV